MPKVSIPAHFPASVDIHEAWNHCEAMRQSQTVSGSALTPLEALSSPLVAPLTAHRHVENTLSSPKHLKRSSPEVMLGTFYRLVESSSAYAEAWHGL